MLRLFSLCHHLEIYKERQRGEGAEGTGWVGFTSAPSSLRCGKKLRLPTPDPGGPHSGNLKGRQWSWRALSPGRLKVLVASVLS